MLIIKFIMKCIIFVVLLFPFLSFSQVNDDFSDGDFTDNPVWTGNDTSFIIDNYQLRSYGPQAAANIIYLSTENHLINNTEWSFLIDLKFNPTSTNFVRVYLVSNKSDITSSDSAYYIEIGQTNQDYIKFFKKSGTTVTQLFTGNTAFANNVKVRLKITRENNGLWSVYSDNSGGYNFVSEGNSFTDNSIYETKAFGFYCQYNTASRYNQYYFDDVKINNIVIDTVPPSVLTVLATDSSNIDIIFSEEVNPSTAENINNYFVDNGVGNPVIATRDQNNKSVVHLNLPQNLQSGIQYNIDILNISDIKGNFMQNSSNLFYYYKPKQFDILINEIMTDQNPAPPLLPPVDYIELYNRTIYPISLNKWKIKLKDDGNYITLGNFIINPNDYLVITTTSGVSQLSQFCSNIIGLSGFTINNETSITLFDKDLNFIHNIKFDVSWYNDESKKDGGWSLEMIDPVNPCGDKENWKASIDNKGGTPGKLNSVYSSNPDLSKPSVSKICILNKKTIKVTFNEKIDLLNAINPSRYIIDKELNIQSISTFANEYNSIQINLTDSIKENKLYSFKIKDSIFDCAGNMVSEYSEYNFAFPINPEKNDVVINEILFNPPLNGVDFVEIYNRSSKNIDLTKLYLATTDPITNKLKSMYNISSDCGILLAKDYLVLTTKPEVVSSQYLVPHINKLLKMNSLPSFNNDKGTVIICTKDSAIIDRFDYEENMHLPLLVDYKGISLERINPDLPTNQRQNWHSAAQSAGFATPTYKNSQYSDLSISDNEISIDPEIFSPDNDGYNDVLKINYKLSKSGYIANVLIFNSKGVLIKNLIKNEYLGTEGNFIWDGYTDNLIKADIGIYIVFVEIFDTEGNVKRYKKSATLAGKF
jgi:hypothetical protein